MPEMKVDRPQLEKPMGVLRTGWSAAVDDYAISGGWTRTGDILVVGDSAGGVYGLEGKSGTVVWSKLQVHEGGLLALAVHPRSNTFATAGQDGRVLLWETTTGEITRSIDVGKSWVEHVRWSPEGRWLAAAHSRQVRVYSESGEEQWCSEDHPSTVSAIAWANANELATACYGRVGFSDVSTGKLGQRLEWKGSLVSMTLSPDGDIVACGSQDNTVHFWRRSTGEDSMMAGYAGKPAALAFDNSGTLLATGGSEAVTVWSFWGGGPEGTRPGVLELHVQPIKTLAFANRGRNLASGGRDGAVVVWALKRDGQGAPIGAALANDIVDGLYWRPDARALAALDAQGGVTVWRVGNL